jgi:hypothetical protein
MEVAEAATTIGGPSGTFVGLWSFVGRQQELAAIASVMADAG